MYMLSPRERARPRGAGRPQTTFFSRSVEESTHVCVVSPRNMVDWYEVASIVEYAGLSQEDRSHLGTMVTSDQRFKRNLDKDQSLVVPFATELDIFHLGMTKCSLLDEKALSRLRHELVNHAYFAVEQKETFKRNVRNMEDEEKGHVAFQVDRALDRALYFLEPFKDKCDIINHHFKVTLASFNEDVIPRNEIIFPVSDGNNPSGRMQTSSANEVSDDES